MRLPPVTKALLWAIGLGYVLQMLVGAATVAPLMLWPLGDVDACLDAACTQSIVVGFRPWQLVTYALLHDPGSIGHLLLNAIALFQFGPAVEQALGARRYGAYLLVCVVGAALLQLAFAASGLAGTALGGTIGASGGIYGVLLAYGLMFPNQRLMLLIPPIPMKARTMVIVFGAISLLMGVTGAQAGIAHFAHLGGMLFGWALLAWWRAQARRPRPPTH
jgi:membrane associated rhomboid family serine protease